MLLSPKSIGQEMVKDRTQTHGDHDRDSALGAVTCVVEHGHGHGCVPARAAGCGP